MPPSQTSFFYIYLSFSFFLFLSITSQYPPLSGPTRLIKLLILSLSKYSFTVSSEILNSRAISFLETALFLCIIFKILLSNSVSFWGDIWGDIWGDRSEERRV